MNILKIKFFKFSKLHFFYNILEIIINIIYHVSLNEELFVYEFIIFN